MSATERLDVFAPILAKSRDPESGVLMVEGKITGPDLDQDQQRMSPAFLSRAVPAWYQIGNIREQHRADSAVGKAVELWDTEDGSWHIRAKIVDKAAAAKVEHGVYTGFSIGISRPRIVKSSDAPMGLITDGDIVETSICDRAALPTARLAVCKSLNGQPLDDVDQVEEIDDEASDLAKAETVEEVLAAVDFLAKTTEPTVIANPDDPDADPGALEKKAKFGGNKAKPFQSEDGGKGGSDADGDGQHNRDDADDDGDGTEDEDDADHPSNKPAKKKPATKAADIETLAADIALIKAALAEADRRRVATPVSESEPAPVEPSEVEKATDPDVVKSVDDEMDDIARARRILADLAILIQSEAEGFLRGNDCEIWDIRALSDVMAQLQFFAEHEEYEMAEAARAAGTATASTDTADKAATPTDAPPAPVEATQPIVLKSAANVADELNRRIEKRLKKARKALAEQAKAETVEKTVTADTPNAAEESPVSQGLTFDDLTKAMGPLAERLAKVQADNEQMQATLAKVLESPRPGGPVVTRVAPAVSPVDAAEKAEKAARAAILTKMRDAHPSPEFRAAINTELGKLTAA